MPSTVHEWHAPPASKTTKILCKPCNVNWGGTLEGRAKPVLLPMVQGYKKRLSSTNQELVALWAVKTAMVFDRSFAAKNQLIPQGSVTHLRQHEQPPPGTVVWLAHYIGETYLASVVSFPFPYFDARYQGELPRGWAVTMCIGQLILQMVNPEGAEARSAEMMRETRGMNVQIWPSIAGRRSWPPKHAKDDAAFAAVSYPDGIGP